MNNIFRLLLLTVIEHIRNTLLGIKYQNTVVGSFLSVQGTLRNHSGLCKYRYIFLFSLLTESNLDLYSMIFQPTIEDVQCLHPVGTPRKLKSEIIMLSQATQCTPLCTSK